MTMNCARQTRQSTSQGLTWRAVKRIGAVAVVCLFMVRCSPLVIVKATQIGLSTLATTAPVSHRPVG
jgi:hypothetical protein